MIQITKHAEKRAKERCGINKQSIRRIADKVFLEGITHKECTGQLKRWVDGLYLSEKTANNIRLYADKAYLFKGEKLITIVPIPNNLQKKLKSIKKRRKDQNIR